MTGLYEYWSLPDKLSIKCPSCQHKANFEFARFAKIQLKKDIDYFQQHPDFEYQRFQDSCGGYWNAAFYYPNLSVDLQQIRDLPETYDVQKWSAPYSSMNKGGVVCESCDCRQKHELNWPNDAYYVAMYRQQVLWAFHREAAIDLYDYLNEDLIVKISKKINSELLFLKKVSILNDPNYDFVLIYCMRKIQN